MSLNATTSRSVSLTGLTANTKYFYRHVCHDSGGGDLYGETVSFTTGTTYTVTYDSNTAISGTVPNDFTLYSASESAFVRGNEGSLIKTGYSFGGWTENSDGSGTVYSPSNTTSIAMTQNRTLYAKWTAITFPVTFDSNTATSGTMSNQTFTAGTGQALTSNSFSKTGFTFAGWATSSGGSVVYSNSEEVTLYETTTVYAKWTANTNNAITWDDQTPTTASSGGSATYTTNSTVATIPTTAPTKSGYTFGGWWTGTNGSGTQITNSSYTPPSPYGSITFYAKWTLGTTYSVTYDDNVAAEAISVPTDSSNYSSGASVTISITEPSRVGYTFEGWNDNSGNTGTTYRTGTGTNTYTVASSNVTLYAKWTADNLTVTYDSQGGSSIASGSTTTGASIAASPGTPTRSGFTFNGWFAASSGGSALTFPYAHGRTANFTLYAQWTADAPSGSSKQSQRISLSDGTLINGQTITLSATGYSGTGAITYELISGDCTVTGNRLTANAGNGSCRVRATIAEDSTYNNASTVASFSMITLSSQTITFAQPNSMRTTDGSQSLSYSASSGLTVTLTVNTPSVCTLSGATVRPAGAGTCSITASQGGNSTYSAADNVTRTFTIEGLSQTISFTQPGSMVSTDNSQSLTASASSGLTVTLTSNSGSVCTVSSTSVTPVAAGTCSITASQPGNSTYSAATSVTRTFTITAAPKLPQNPEFVPPTA
ncbi:MAG: InlB B-repeat-containing protein, partial [Bacteroidota bacterium]